MTKCHHFLPSSRLESLEENVNHPKRYTKGKIECIDALESAVAGKTPEEAICVANVIKYLWRYEEKEPLRSLKSAEWYLKRLISKYEIDCGASDADWDNTTSGIAYGNVINRNIIRGRTR